MQKLFALLGLSLLLFSAPAFAQADGDGDGVDDSIDLCPTEDASFFDADGDGCFDATHNARHVEYWPASSLPLHYVIHVNGAPSVSDGSDFTAIQAGFDAWPAVPGVALSATYDGTTTDADADGMDGINQVTFEDSTFLTIYGNSVLAVGVTTSFTVPSDFNGAPVRPGEIVDADMIFNPLRIFATDTTAIGPDLQSVATHEAGHLFGFAHSATVTSTMFPALPVGTNARTLEVEDQVLAFMGYPDAGALATATSIGGTVTDGATSAPIGGAAVFAISEATGDTLGSQFTFADGSWRFVGLPEGSYYVGISPMDGSNTNSVVPAYINDYVVGIATNTLWNPEYWDLAESATDDDLAKDPVSLSAGVPVTGIDIQTNTDLTAPTLLTVAPDGSETVRADAVFFIEFDEAIDFDSAAENVVLNKLTVAGPTPVGFALLQVTDDNVIIVDPAGLMDYGTEYEIVLEAGLSDRFGNGIGTEVTTPFTVENAPPLAISTASPQIVSGGTVMVIYGEGFDLTDPANNSVDFGGTAVPASTANSNAISVQVPKGLVDGTIPLTVSTLLETSNTLEITAVTSNDIVKGTDVTTVDLGGEPARVALLPDGVFSYVATDTGLDVVSTGFGNPDFGSLVTIANPDGFVDVAAAPGGNRIYALSRLGRELWVIDSDYGDVDAPNPTFNRILDQKSTSGEPVGIAVDPAGERAYIATDSGQVEVWDIELGSATYHRQIGLLESGLVSLAGPIAVDRTGLRVIALAGSGEALVWDASDPTAPPDVVMATSDPRDVTIDPQGIVAYLVDGSGSVSVLLLATSAISQTIPVGGEPRAMTVTPSGLTGYVADRVNDELPALDLNVGSASFRTVIGELAVGDAPIDVEVAPSADYAVILEDSAQQLRILGIGQGPQITNISPQWVTPGDILTINGRGFVTVRPWVGMTSTNHIYFEDIPANTEYADFKSMPVTVPSGFAGGSLRTSFEGPAAIGFPTEYFSNPVSVRMLEHRDGGSGRDVFLSSPNGYAWDDVGVVATVAAAPNGKFVIAVSLANRAYLIDADRNSPNQGQILGSINMSTGGKPGRMVIAPDSRLAYYAGLDEEIHILDVDPASPTYLTEIGTVLNTLQGTFSGPSPDLMEITPSGLMMVVSDALNDQLYFVDLDPESDSYHETIVETGPLGFATGLAIHPSGLVVYFVASTGLLHLVSLDIQNEGYLQQMGTFQLETSARDIEVSPDGNFAYLVDREYSIVGTLALEVWSTASPYSPSFLDWVSLGTASANERSAGFLSPTGTRLIVDSPADGQTYMLEVGPQVVETYEIIDFPQINGTIDLVDVAWMPDGSGFWAASRGDTGISYVDMVDAAKIEPVSGQGQTGVAGQPLPAPIVYRVTDGGVGLAAGAVAEVQITSGGGTLGNGSDYQWLTADAEGKIYIDWTLGPVPDTGTPNNTLTVSFNNGFSVANGITAASVADPGTLPLNQVQVLPADNSTNISLTSSVQVTFSRGVDPATIDASTLGLRRQGDSTPVEVAYGFASGNQSVSMIPLTQLEPTTTFEVYMTAGILDSAGGPLSNPTVTTFTTRNPPPLTISAITPPAATVGTQIVISGEGFAASAADNVVNFGAKSTPASSVGAGYIRAYVPLGATSGDLTVVANAQTSNPGTFTVLVPETAPLDEIISTVDTGISIQSVAVTPDGAKAYTVSTEANEVLPVDLDTFTNLTAIGVGSSPRGVVIHPDGSHAYVTNFGSGSVSVIEVASDTVVKTINVGTNPVELVASPLGDRLYVVNTLDQTLSVIDIDASSATYHTVVASAPTSRSTQGAAIAPDGTVLYLGTADGYITIELVTSSFGVVSGYSTGKSTKGAAITPDGSLLLLVTTSNEVLIVDVGPGGSNAVVATVPTTKSTKGAAITPDGSLLYLLQEDSDEILVVELNIGTSVGSAVISTPVVVTTRVVKSIPVDQDPGVIAFDPSGSGLAVISHAGPAGKLSFLNASSIPRGQYTATVELAPLELNDVTRGFYMNVYLIMPDEVDATGVDLASIRMNGTLPAVVEQCDFVDRDQDGDLDVRLRFERREVVKLLPRADSVDVYISGVSEPGHRSFVGMDAMSTRWPIVLRPFGNQLLLGGIPYEIQWSNTGAQADYVYIHHSAVGGAWWRWVSYNAPDTGGFVWLVPPIFSHNSIIELVFYRDVPDAPGNSIEPIDQTQPDNNDEILAIVLSENFRVKDPAVPVVMQDVELRVEDGAGRIEWGIGDAQAVEGFNVFRSDREDGIYERVNVDAVRATSSRDGLKFVFEDESIYANRDYFYMLQEDRGDEPGFEHGPYRLNWRLENALFQNSPNSFNPRTTIRFSIAEDGRTKLAVYNLAGRLVDVIVDEVLRADSHSYVWDGTDRDGRSVASGVYVYRLTAPGGFAAAKKMTLVR